MTSTTRQLHGWIPVCAVGTRSPAIILGIAMGLWCDPACGQDRNISSWLQKQCFGSGVLSRNVAASDLWKCPGVRNRILRINVFCVGTFCSTLEFKSLCGFSQLAFLCISTPVPHRKAGGQAHETSQGCQKMPLLKTC